MLSVTEEIGSLLFGATTSNEAWTHLLTLFDYQTAAREDFLERQWRNLQKGSKSMVEFINSVKRLANQFAQIGKTKTMAEINRCLMNGLGSDWEPLVLIVSPSLNKMTTNELGALLLNN